MTAVEVFKEITSEPKWYAGFTTPQNASNIKKRFEEQKLEFGTLEKMFNHFGYYLTASWDKGKPCQHIFKIVDDGTGRSSYTAQCIKCGSKL